MEKKSFVVMAALLGTLTMMMPLGTDIFLPSMPNFAREYGVAMGAAELTLSAFFAGNAAGQLIWGPVSDRFGRKPVILVAVSMYFVAAALIAVSDSVGPVLLLRFLQGMAAASGRILANAVSRDLFDRERLAKLIAFIMTFGAISAAITGPLGGLIANTFSWQAAFVVTAGFAAILLVLFIVVFKETIPEKNPLAINPVPMALTMVGILRHRVFLSYALTSACGMMGLSAFLNSSPGLLIGVFGLEPAVFGLMFAMLPAGFMTGAILVGRYTERFGADRFLQIGSAGMAVAGLIMFGHGLVGVVHPILLVAPMLLYLFGFALLIPQTASGALSPFGRTAGTAASLQGFTQSMMGATMSAVLALVQNDTVYPMVTAIAFAGLATLSCYLFLIRPAQAAQGRDRGKTMR